MILKSNTHSPSTSKLQRGSVSIDEVGVFSTPFKYLRGEKTLTYLDCEDSCNLKLLGTYS